MAKPQQMIVGSAFKSAVAPWDLDSDVGWTNLTGDSNISGVDLYFHYVPWLFRAVKDRAGNVGALPWSIMRGDEELATSAEWADEKPTDLEWLQSPRKLFGQVEQSLAMTARAYIGLECNNFGYIKGAKYFAPSTITEIYDTNGALTGYERNVNGHKVECDRADAKFRPGVVRIVAIYDADYMTEIGPSKSSAALAALCASGVLFSTDRFIETFFSRGAIKASILSVEAGSESELNRLTAWWEDVIAGVKNAWSAVVMRGKVNQPIVIGQGTEGLENEALTTTRRQDISTALGVPESRLWSAAANYATRVEDEKAYFRGTIIPEFDLIAEALNAQVFNKWHKLEGFRIESQPETLDVFQADEANRAGSLAQLTGAGIPLKLAMEILGYDLTEEQWEMLEPEEPEEPEPVAPVVPVVEPAVVEAEPEEEPEPTRSLTPEMLKELEIWQRKAIKAFKSGVSANCEFVTERITDGDEIRAALDGCKSIDEIKAVFAQQQNGALDNPLLVLANELKLAREALAHAE